MEYSLTIEVLIFGLFIGIVMAHHRFSGPSKIPNHRPAKRLFPRSARSRTPSEKVRQEIVSAQMAKKLKDILGFTKDPLKAKELKEKAYPGLAITGNGL